MTSIRSFMRIVEGADRAVTDTPAFKVWFGDSKIVDDQGRPKIVYHGTRSDVDRFNASASGEYGPGIYLTDDEGTANFYATDVARGEHGPNIVPLYASIQNPFRVSKTDWIKMTTRSTPRTVQKRLIAKGHDGIIGVGLTGAEQIVAFRSEQVKSAISNRTFDPTSPNIMEADRSLGTHDEEAARKIGDCTIEAIARVTGLPWKTVWEAAKPHFGRHGMHSGGVSATLRALGWGLEGYNKMPWFHGMTVRQAEEWLRANDPDVTLICTIMVDRMPHAISYKRGRFDNVQGAYKAKLRLVDRVFPV